MFSKEFMKYIYNYKKDEFESKETSVKEIHFKNRGSGKLAEILLTVKK